jgi:hypothetical protein
MVQAFYLWVSVESWCTVLLLYLYFRRYFLGHCLTTFSGKHLLRFPLLLGRPDSGKLPAKHPSVL